ncbi:MAG: hypothetical protein IKG85_00340 [Clostridia bacterium]|nr:hypothetical protein [Clostridia bacterium]
MPETNRSLIDKRRAARRRSPAIRAALAAVCACLLAFAGCFASPGGEDTGIVEIIPGAAAVTAAPASAATDEVIPSDEPAPTPTAAPASLEERILSGVIYPLAGGAEISSSFGGEHIDLDGDGSPEFINVSNVDGGPTLCIGEKPFMDVGTRVFLASLDGERIVFLSQKPGTDGYFIFYPDEGGNLYCRLFAIARSGSPDALAVRPSYEEYVRSGLDIMLHNPMLYSSFDGKTRTILLDMDGDGSREEITFDSETLRVNGRPNSKILSTTMPRFIYDAEHGAIVIYGSAGDYALSLRYSGGELIEDISYASLL